MISQISFILFQFYAILAVNFTDVRDFKIPTKEDNVLIISALTIKAILFIVYT